MKVLFDQGTPAPLRHCLAGHEVKTAHEQGWSALRNGDLLALAEQAEFEVFVTTDRNLKYQQNLAGREVAIVVLLSTSWPRIREVTAAVQAAVDAAGSGDYVEVTIPARA